MSRRQGLIHSDVPVAIGAAIAFVLYVWLLTQATIPVLTALSFASDTRPKLYAALLALLVGLPGVLLTVPRAFSSPQPRVQPTVRERRQLAQRRQTFIKTDLIGLAVMLLAQVPLPSPWGPAGKAATIANVTKAADIVDVSARFATWSLGILFVGIGAAVLVRVYHHAIAYRVLGVALVVATPLVAWLVIV